MSPFLRIPGKRSDPIAAAERLESDGRPLEAIDVLVEANRRNASAAVESRLVTARHRAFEELAASVGGPAGIEVAEAAATSPHAPLDSQGVPSVAAEDLSPAAITEAILGHGCLIVRGLVDDERVTELKAGIDRVFDGRDAHAEGVPVEETTPWFEPFVADGEYAPSVVIGRGFVNKGSGTWIADSPRFLFDLLETFGALGLREIITKYLGERPAISVNKGTLRRLPPQGGTEWWHQDGAFLGEGIRSLNVWLSLSDCGTEAPGLDLVPKRLEGIVEAGTRGADFDWSVSDEVVDEVSGGTIVRPEFAPGDALLFDHLFLHRTGTDPGMTQPRYATETWFFAPSAYPNPHEQVPLVF